MLATALGRTSSAVTQGLICCGIAEGALDPGNVQRPFSLFAAWPGSCRKPGVSGASGIQEKCRSGMFSGPLSLATRVHLEPVCTLLPNKQLSGRVNKLISWEKNLLQCQCCL